MTQLTLVGGGPSGPSEEWTPASPTSSGGVSAEHWYRADQGTWQDAGITVADDDAEVVGRWEDLTANADHVNQTTAANKPILKLNIIYGHPVIRFDGSNDTLIGTYTNGGSMSQPITVFAVAVLSATADTVKHLIDGTATGHRPILRQSDEGAAGLWGIAAATSVVGGASDTNWNIWTALFNGASSQLWLNGVSELTGDAGTNDGAGLRVGTNTSGLAGWLGDIAELIFFDAELSDADKDEVGHYLADRYGIAYTDIS